MEQSSQQLSAGASILQASVIMPVTIIWELVHLTPGLLENPIMIQAEITSPAENRLLHL